MLSSALARVPVRQKAKNANVSSQVRFCISRFSDTANDSGRITFVATGVRAQSARGSRDEEKHGERYVPTQINFLLRKFRFNDKITVCRPDFQFAEDVKTTTAKI